MSKYTKGPWKINGSFFDLSCHIDGFEADYKSSNDTETDLKEVMQANAQLIAAAPELLEALQKVKTYLIRELPPVPNSSLDLLTNIVFEAIKKAQGEK